MKALVTLSLLAGMSFVSVGSAEPPPIDCQTEPGFSVCREIRVLESYMVGCSGGCDDLFRRQTRTSNRVADVYYGHIAPGTRVSAELGAVAQNAASKICRYSWSNVEVGTLSNILTGINRALNAMKELQVQAGIASPRWCRMVER